MKNILECENQEGYKLLSFIMSLIVWFIPNNSFSWRIIKGRKWNVCVYDKYIISQQWWNSMENSKENRIISQWWYRRHRETNAALKKLRNIWIRDVTINVNIKVKSYETLVKSFLTYNCSWALTQTQVEKYRPFAVHHKQLWLVLNIHYQVIISNKSLHKQCNKKHLFTFIVQSHWCLFGHSPEGHPCL